MIDLNDDKYRKLLADAGNSKVGKIIVEFLQKELDKIDYESIDPKSTEQTAIEYLAMRKTREYLKKCLIYLIGR